MSTKTVLQRKKMRPVVAFKFDSEQSSSTTQRRTMLIRAQMRDIRMAVVRKHLVALIKCMCPVESFSIFDFVSNTTIFIIINIIRTQNII